MTKRNHLSTNSYGISDISFDQFEDLVLTDIVVHCLLKCSVSNMTVFHLFCMICIVLESSYQGRLLANIIVIDTYFLHLLY